MAYQALPPEQLVPAGQFLPLTGGTLSGPLVADGTVTMNDPVTVNSTLEVNDDLTVDTGALTVQGPLGKGFRVRTTGSDVDFEFSGAGGGESAYVSMFVGPFFAGAQRTYLRLESGVQLLHLIGALVNGTTPFASEINWNPAAIPSTTGSRGGNAALTDLLTDLDGIGVIEDNTVA